QRPLPEIIQQEGREDEAQPGAANWGGTEMSHIGIKRLGPGHSQHNRAEQDKPFPRVGQYQIDRVARIERFQNGRPMGDLRQSEEADRAEPQNDDWAEKAADPAGSALLEDE